MDDDNISKLDSGTLKHVNLLHGLQFVKAVWNSVTGTTIKNCWQKAGFCPPGAKEASVEPSAPATTELELSDAPDNLQNDIAELQQLDSTVTSTILNPATTHQTF